MLFLCLGTYLYSHQGYQESNADLAPKFKPAFLGRFKKVACFQFAGEVVRKILRLKLLRIARRMLENGKVVFR